MITFDGYLSGNALKHFERRFRNTGIITMCVSLLLFMPFAVYVFSWISSVKNALIAYCSIMVILPLLMLLIPQSKKERKAMTPKNITIDDDCMICIADKYTERRSLGAVKQVRDFGEYYDFVFVFGKLSDKFVCQKSLLEKGNLYKFEQLFEDKLIRKTK